MLKHLDSLFSVSIDFDTEHELARGFVLRRLSADRNLNLNNSILFQYLY